LWLCSPVLATLQNQSEVDNKTLLIGTKVTPPFAMKSSEGKWQGVSIELWEEIAKRLHLDYVWQERNLESLLSGVENSELDVSIAALTITADREKRIDFSHAYYSTGLSIAVPIVHDGGWKSVVKGILSLKMLIPIGILLSVLLVIGAFTWFIERKRNPKSFNPDPVRGIASGIWWAAVTMTTVGYGDKTPKTLGGRLVALFWMFSSLLLLSTIIASVTSALTLSQLEPLVSGPEDLAKARIASVEKSTSDQYLKSRRLSATYYDSVLASLKALDKHEVDAVVYDKPLLQYLVKQDYENSLKVDDSLFEHQYYGIAFPEGSSLREPVNRALLEIIEQDKWQDILSKYLGD